MVYTQVSTQVEIGTVGFPEFMEQTGAMLMGRRTFGGHDSSSS
jgi:hypothetical protein